MKLCCSILDLNPKTKEEVELIKKSGIDLIHLDVMDGIFVKNKSFEYEEVKKLKIDNFEIHFMVDDIKYYIEKYKDLKPNLITIHLENKNLLDNIKLIKENGIKVGLAINPTTDINLIIPYLNIIDQVLVMSVMPGLGGQKFNMDMLNRIDYLFNYKKNNNLNYYIEVDGGVNKDNINLLKKCDKVVVGSFITKGNYVGRVKELKEEII